MNEEATRAYILTPSRPKAHSKAITRLKGASTLSSLIAMWQITKMKGGNASPSLKVEANMPSWVVGLLPTLSMSCTTQRLQIKHNVF